MIGSAGTAYSFPCNVNVWMQQYDQAIEAQHTDYQSGRQPSQEIALGNIAYKINKNTFMITLYHHMATQTAEQLNEAKLFFNYNLLKIITLDNRII